MAAAPPPAAATVRLTLVDISGDVANDGKNATLGIEPFVDEALLAGGAGCIEAKHAAYLYASGDEASGGGIDIAGGTKEEGGGVAVVRERIKKSILRYLQLKDKYTALCSVLLKSRAFHQTHHEQSDDDCCADDVEKSARRRGSRGGEPLPVVELSKTEYGKPYIPARPSSATGEIDSRCGDGDAGSNAQCHTISVSHQFPHVGLARLSPSMARPKSSRPPVPSVRTPPPCIIPDTAPLHVGLDIVTFDPPSPRLYSTVDAFLDVFKDSFTAWEWDRVVNRRRRRRKEVKQTTDDGTMADKGDSGGRTTFPSNFFRRSAASASSGAIVGGGDHIRHERLKRADHDSLREFYLRWAVKESYTKALGVGMGLEFSAFETRLVGIDHDDESDKCWDGKEESSGIDSGLFGALSTCRLNRQQQEGGIVSLASLFVRGRIIRLHQKNGADERTEEIWDFNFFGLPPPASTDALDGESEISDSQIGGCACVCAGPVNGDCAPKVNVTQMEWMSISDLVHWSKCDIDGVGGVDSS